jgi:hypothetical protein
MKSKEEIEQLAFLEYPRVINDPYNPMEDDNAYERQIWIDAYTLCQEDMELSDWDVTLTDGLEEVEWDTKPTQSPKDKAKEMYIKFDFVYVQNYTSKFEVKQCALIAVDETIRTLNEDIRDLDVRGNILLDLIEYWREVKQEIDKL